MKKAEKNSIFFSAKLIKYIVFYESAFKDFGLMTGRKALCK